MRALAIFVLMFHPMADAAHAAELPPLSCILDRTCVTDQPCAAAADAFQLDPTDGGYSAVIDSDSVVLQLVSPPQADVKTFLLATPESVSMMLSVFPDLRVILTTQEDIDGPHFETSTGQCVEEQ